MSSKKEQIAIKRISMAEKRVDRQLESLRKQEERLLKLKEKIQLGKDKLQMIRNKLSETKEKYEPFIVQVEPVIIQVEQEEIQPEIVEPEIVEIQLIEPEAVEFDVIEPEQTIELNQPEQIISECVDYIYTKTIDTEIIEPEETVEQIISEYVDYIISNPLETESTQSSDEEKVLEIKTSSITVQDDNIITLEHNQEYEEEVKTISIYEDLDIKENVKIIPEEKKEKSEKKPKKKMGLDFSEYIVAEPETVQIDTMQPKIQKKQNKKQKKVKEELPESNIRISRPKNKRSLTPRSREPEKRQVSPIKVIQTNQTGTQNILREIECPYPEIDQQQKEFQLKYGEEIKKKTEELFKQYENKKRQELVGNRMNKKQQQKFDEGLKQKKEQIYSKVYENVFNNCPETKQIQEQIKLE